MRAEKARELTKRTRHEVVTVEYEAIQAKILLEVNSGNGDYHITVFGTMLPETIKMLEEDGYTVTVEAAGFNETDCKISWA